MTKVDLYLIPGNGLQDQVQFCCRLIDKAVQHGNRIHVQTREAFQSEALNEALWSFRADAFIPHCIGQADSDDVPVTIDLVSLQKDKTQSRDVLILLDAPPPSNLLDFKRLCIVVPNDKDALQAARSHYKQLAQQKLNVNTHDLRK